MRDSYSQFIDLALEGINYEQGNNGDFHADIPGFYGLKAQGATKEACNDQMRAELRAWLMDRKQNGLTIPLVGGYRVATLDFEVQAEKKDRLQRIEHDIQLLKIDLDQDFDGGKLFTGYAHRFNSWYKSYWQLVVSLTSLSIIAIAYLGHGVDPIQSYRETGDKIKGAQKYVEIGDKLLLDSGSTSSEAERAYGAALELYPSNLSARGGLLKAQILNVEPGKGEYDIGKAQAKLSAARVYLGEDYYLFYTEGMIALHQAFAATNVDQAGLLNKANEAFEKSRELQPKFTGNYLGLGICGLLLHGPKTALNIFKEARESGHTSAAMLTYLGSLNASGRNLGQAETDLKAANILATHIETLILLGEVYRNKSDILSKETDRVSYLRGAIATHLNALAMAGRTDLVRGIDYDEFFYTEMPWDFCELTDDFVWKYVGTPNSFKVLAYYSLSFDYVLTDDQANAEKNFDAGFLLDPCVTESIKGYKYWYESRVDHLISERKNLSREAKGWLLAKKRRFESC